MGMFRDYMAWRKNLLDGMHGRVERSRENLDRHRASQPSLGAMSSTQAAPARAAAAEMVRYEYKVEGFRREGFRREGARGVQARLNRLGKQGWEITTSTHAGSLDFAANRYTVTLRRPRKLPAQKKNTPAGASRGGVFVSRSVRRR